MTLARWGQAALLGILLVGVLPGAWMVTRAAPDGQLDENLVVTITSPQPGERLQGRVNVAGFAADRRSPSGSGLNERDVQVFVNDSAEQQNLLDYALAGLSSPEAAQALGLQFDRTGFRLSWDTCASPPGRYEVIVWVSSLQVPGARNYSMVPVEVVPCATAAPSGTFNCGAQTLTFAVRAPDDRPGRGVRCVRIDEGAAALVWYGEGQWPGATYRNLGYATLGGGPGAVSASAADIFGNGANTNGVFPGSLELRLAAGSWAEPREIRVTGAWNEIWSLVAGSDHFPLPRPGGCGSHLPEYRVSDLSGRAQGTGLRCVLEVGGRPVAWFGNGQWENATYSHVGLLALGGDGQGRGGASDLCGPGFGGACGSFAWGSLRFAAAAPRGFDVTGAWNEAWR